MFQLESSWHGRSVDHVLTYSGGEIAVGSQKPSRITRQKTCCAIVMAWEERGSCLNLFRRRNRGRTSETFMNYEAKDLLRYRISETFTNDEAKDLLRKHGRSVDHVLTYSGRKIEVGYLKSLQITTQKTCCAYEKSRSDLRNLHELRSKRLVPQVSETHRFALFLRTGVVLMLQLESSWHGRSVDHVLTYFGRQIAVGFEKPSRITVQKTG
ncbi:uncharacterized protein G2W53_026464 [Senna tora]|uniref:Uncharacterized protein n=1 Tax=Senna tora TaxID=362788 RepID=A0A834TP15_9FABA|nr:uncharacterized protein G2W53_026464 [Senna tora]